VFIDQTKATGGPNWPPPNDPLARSEVKKAFYKAVADGLHERVGLSDGLRLNFQQAPQTQTAQLSQQECERCAKSVLSSAINHSMYARRNSSLTENRDAR
jgi:hypothetical protein